MLKNPVKNGKEKGLKADHGKPTAKENKRKGIDIIPITIKAHMLMIILSMMKAISLRIQ